MERTYLLRFGLTKACIQRATDVSADLMSLGCNLDDLQGIAPEVPAGPFPVNHWAKLEWDENGAGGAAFTDAPSDVP